MPPGPAFNFLCAAAGLANVLSHAARLRAAQVAPKCVVASHASKGSPVPEESLANARSDALQEFERERGPTTTDSFTERRTVQEDTDSELPPISKTRLLDYGAGESAEKSHRKTPRVIESDVFSGPNIVVEKPPFETAQRFRAPATDAQYPLKLDSSRPRLFKPESELPSSITVESADVRQQEPQNQSTDILGETEPHIPSTSAAEITQPSRTLRSSKVPSSRIGRLFHYGSLAASLGYGAAAELLQRSANVSQDSQSPVMMTEANIQRLVSKLLKMRGAALKLGQFMSIQDAHVLPPTADKIFRMVQDSAHYMPDWQMEQVLVSSLGADWQSNFESFERIPFAAASIGQVHKAVLNTTKSPTGKPELVAVKIQFPNIADSIDSDLSYIKLLLTAGKLLPKGLFLDRTIQVMKEELAEECDYRREAYFLRMFGRREYLGGDPRFKIPWVWDGSTDNVLVMERVNGISVGDANIGKLSQQDRDDIASRIIELCLRELFEFGIMQTDPNWTNFLWNPQTRQIELVDFGATREYSQEFTDNWLQLLQAAVSQDRNQCIEWSTKLGYLTGEENDIMLDAHVDSMMLLAAPFTDKAPQPFSFGQNSIWADVTAKIRANIPVMLQHRCTPPPRETYSLNRKLSGSFLLASRLGANVNTRELWEKVVKNYQFST